MNPPLPACSPYTGCDVGDAPVLCWRWWWRAPGDEMLHFCAAPSVIRRDCGTAGRPVRRAADLERSDGMRLGGLRGSASCGESCQATLKLLLPDGVQTSGLSERDVLMSNGSWLAFHHAPGVNGLGLRGQSKAELTDEFAMARVARTRISDDLVGLEGVRLPRDCDRSISGGTQAFRSMLSSMASNWPLLALVVGRLMGNGDSGKSGVGSRSGWTGCSRFGSNFPSSLGMPLGERKF